MGSDRPFYSNDQKNNFSVQHGYIDLNTWLWDVFIFPRQLDTFCTGMNLRKYLAKLKWSVEVRLLVIGILAQVKSINPNWLRNAAHSWNFCLQYSLGNKSLFILVLPSFSYVLNSPSPNSVWFDWYWYHGSELI